MLENITEQELAENGVASAPDHLTGKAADNKKLFDKLITAIIAPHLNRAIDALNKLELDMGEADEALRQALRDHIDIDPTSVRDNNVSVTQEVIRLLELEGANPTVKDALLRVPELINQGTNTRARVVLGTYIGTGVYGADNPNVIELGFKPKLVFINKSFGTPNGATSYGSWVRDSISIFYGNGQNHCEGYFSTSASWHDAMWTATATETGLTWYYTLGTASGVDSSNTAACQLNDSDTEYTYIAIG